jgi:hypothetical protein
VDYGVQDITKTIKINKMTALTISLVVGWVFLILANTETLIIKDKEKSSILNLALAAFALGVFISTAIFSFIK